jgi:antitoxin component HigA of HigAB toxin-antitoxin module
MDTKLRKDSLGWIWRLHEEDAPEWIGCIEESPDGVRWFRTYRDNRNLSLSELKQLIAFVETP